MKPRSIVIALLSLTTVLPMSGCLLVAAGAAGVGTYAYVTGKLETTQEVPLDKAFEATKAGIKDLEFTLVEEKKDALYGEVRAKTADNTSVTVTLKPLTEKTTEFSIRVGVFGDEDRSRLIMDKIKTHF